MIWFKSCRRCGGDLSLEKDDYGSYMLCIQCGFHGDIEMDLTATSRQPVPAFVQGALRAFLGVPLALEDRAQEESNATSGKAA